MSQMRAELKLRIPLPDQTEQSFGKGRYSRREKYPKRVMDFLEEAEKEQDEILEDVSGQFE